MQPLLNVENVSKRYLVRAGFFDPGRKAVWALDNVSLQVRPNETLGLVGESGCGKSTLARVALALEPPSSGRVEFEQKELASLDKKAIKAFRQKAQMVFQDPYSSLNPKMTIFQILSEPLRIHKLCPRSEMRHRVEGLLESVGLEPRSCERYPHEFSGGQRQRIGVARALATNPKLIVADEPTSALDVSVQAQIINLLLDLKEKRALSFLFISHDLPVVQFVSDRVAVMYKGQMVELLPADKFLYKGKVVHHPYTEVLLEAVPLPDPSRRRKTAVPVEEAGKEAENSGCNFASRCRNSSAICYKERPQAVKIDPDHTIWCHHIQ